MAGNMAQMGGPGGMMPQQQQQFMNGANGSALKGQMQNYLAQALKNCPPPPTGLTWHNNLGLGERLQKTMALATNVYLAQQSGSNIDIGRISEFAANYERDTYHKAPSRETWQQAMDSKIHEFYQKRVQNAQSIQNDFNQNYNNQQAQAQAAQQQAMMGMQFNMGRGMPPGLQQMQRSTQMPNMQAQQHQRQLQQQQQQQFRQQQQQQSQPQAFQQQQFQQQQMPQQQFPMGMANNMGNQAGPTMGQNPSMMGVQQNRPLPPLQDIAKLNPADKKKVHDLSAKMLNESTPEQKQQALNFVQQRMPPEQLQRMQASGQSNPLLFFFQQRAFHILAKNVQNPQNRQAAQAQQGQPGQQVGQPNLNVGQAPMMQQQASQQSFQQRQNMANPQATNDFTQQFANGNNMDSIIDQQMKGFMAQESGQPVVPATSSRPPSSQPMAATMSNQTQNQTPRPPQQQQPPTQQQTQQQQQLAMQMRMNQANQQNQNQLHPQAAQMQQPGAGPSQSPGMGTLNTPVARPNNSMEQVNGQGMQGFGVGGQAFKHAMQSNPNLMNSFMAAIPPNQRQSVHNMSQEQLQMVIAKWQSARRENLQGQRNQMQNRPPSQMGQPNGNMPNANMNAQGIQGIPAQMGQPNGFNQQRGGQPPTPPTQGNQAQTMMDSMDLPTSLTQQDVFAAMPQEVRKWKDLRQWLNQNPTAIPHPVRTSLGNIQHRQFQAIMQKRMQDKANAQAQAQATNMNQTTGMQSQPQSTAQPQQPQQQMQPQGVQQGLEAGIPPQVMQVSPQEMASFRQSHRIPPNAPDVQVHAYIRNMKIQNFKKMHEAQRLQRMQAQAQGQQAGVNGLAVSQPQAHQPTPTQTMPTPQQAQMPTPNPNQPAQAKQQAPAKPQAQSGKNKKAPTPAQANKNLKRPSADISADGGNAQQRRAAQQQAGKNANAAAGEDNAARQQMQRQQAPGADGSENLNRLRTIGQEEQKRFAQESMPDIQMTPAEYQSTVEKLRRIVVDMGKIGRGLSKWYGISKDDERARGFFRMRLRIIRQFKDGEKMEAPRQSFSINMQELDRSRNMLEGMARDIAQHFKTKQPNQAQGQQLDASAGSQAPSAQEFANQQQRLLSQKQQQQQQQQLAQQMQAQQAQKSQAEQQPAPAPLNAANLEKNTQALKNQKAATKGAKPPSAPTTSQPPFQIGASSPHGNPSYVGTVKDMKLTLPPKKKTKFDKQAGQNSQTATPSPNVSTKTPPVPQQQKQQEAPRPVMLCQDPECAQSGEGYPSEEALQRHVQDEHIKPKQDPVKFLAENLALALGLDLDGSPKKDQKQVVPPNMGPGASKQDNSSFGTPKSEPGSMNRSASMQSKVDPKNKSAPVSPRLSFNAQAVLTKLGFPSGISSIAWDPSVLRNLTPKDTPDSVQDSGVSEPTTEMGLDLLNVPMQDFAMDWGWGSANDDILAGDRIPWNQEYVPQPGDEELLENTNYQEVDWSDLSKWNRNPNHIDTAGWSMQVS